MTFPKMRRKDREISKEEAMALLTKIEYGILSTTGENGYPYGVPVNYVSDEKYIYFHCAGVGSKLENIRNNPKVCFTAVGDTSLLPSQFSTEYESVIVFGIAQEVTSEHKADVLQLLIDKYSSDFKKEGAAYIGSQLSTVSVYKISIEHITSKCHKK